MNLRPVAMLLAGVSLCTCVGQRCCAQAKTTDSVEGIRTLLMRVAAASPDPCESPSKQSDDAVDIESSIFGQAGKMVTDSLNLRHAGTARPQDGATEMLKKVETISSQVNAAWPLENRFHFRALDVPPLVVVEMTLGSQARFYVFGTPEIASDGSKGNQVWQEVGSDDISFEHPAPSSWLDLYPLHRGPSGRARFLAAIGYTGCAGSSGLAYEAYEWDPSGAGVLVKAINQEGARGMDEAFDGHKPTAKDPFAPIGALRTAGSTITLPYCWFSAIDYWDNPSLCAVDTYDLAGDEMRFVSRAYNRPELVSIAKALEYAGQRDYQALLGYCGSSGVARRLLRGKPTLDFASDPRVIHAGKGEERVEFGDPPGTVFNVAKRSNVWVVVSFRSE